MKKYKNRSSVEEKYKWDLTDFFSNEEEFLKTYRKTQKNIEKLSQYVGCTKDAEKLYEFLNLEYLTISLWEDLYVYSYLIHDQELGNAEAIERKNQTEILNLELEKSIHFFSPELLKLSKKDYHQLFLDHPKLKEYQAALDLIYREKGHVLGEEEENIVSSPDIINLESEIKEELDALFKENDIQNIREYQKRINNYIVKKSEIAGNLSPEGSYIKTLVESRTNLSNKLTR